MLSLAEFNEYCSLCLEASFENGNDRIEPLSVIESLALLEMCSTILSFSFDEGPLLITEPLALKEPLALLAFSSKEVFLSYKNFGGVDCFLDGLDNSAKSNFRDSIACRSFKPSLPGDCEKFCFLECLLKINKEMNR